MSESPTLPGWYNNSISLADRCKLPKVCSTSKFENVIIIIIVVINSLNSWLLMIFLISIICMSLPTGVNFQRFAQLKKLKMSSLSSTARLNSWLLMIMIIFVFIIRISFVHRRKLQKRFVQHKLQNTNLSFQTSDWLEN